MGTSFSPCPVVCAACALCGGGQVHDAYHDHYTLIDQSHVESSGATTAPGRSADGNGSAPRAAPGTTKHVHTGRRISVAAHADRIEQALRSYLPLLRCLPPERTITLWLTPYAHHGARITPSHISQASPQLRTPSHRYDSFKAPWQRPLVNATREVMLKLRRVGLFRHALVVDAWHLTAAPGAPSAWDGAHREVMLQTLIWTLVRFAYGRLAGGGATPRRGGAGVRERP